MLHQELTEQRIRTDGQRRSHRSVIVGVIDPGIKLHCSGSAVLFPFGIINLRREKGKGWTKMLYGRDQRCTTTFGA